MTAKEMIAKAIEHEQAAIALRREAQAMIDAEERAKPVGERLVYAAFTRCPCGAGMAYDPQYQDENSVFFGPLSNAWDCSAILLGTADKAVKHTDRLPFAFCDIKSEQQNSANGATTRAAK